MRKLSLLTCIGIIGCISVFSPRTASAQTVVSPVNSSPQATANANTTSNRVAGFTGFTIRFTAQVRVGHEPEMSYPTVDKVLPESPAARAGVHAGDLIIEVNGHDARVRGALFPVEGIPYVMRVRRGDTEREIMLTPVAKP